MSEKEDSVRNAALVEQGKLAKAKMLPTLPELSRAVSEESRKPQYTLGTDRKTHLVVITAFLGALPILPVLRDFGPYAFWLAVASAYLQLEGYLTAPDLMVPVNQALTTPSSAESVLTEVGFFDRPEGAAAKALVVAQDIEVSRGLLAVAALGDGGGRQLRWQQLEKGDGLVVHFHAFINDLLGETVETPRAELRRGMKDLEKQGVDYDSSVPLAGIAKALAASHGLLRAKSAKAEVPYTCTLVDVMERAFIKNAVATSLRGKGLLAFVQHQWFTVCGQFGRAETMVDEFVARISRGVDSEPEPDKVPCPLAPIPGMTSTAAPVVQVHAAPVQPSSSPGPVPPSPSSPVAPRPAVGGASAPWRSRTISCFGCGGPHHLRYCTSTPRVPGTDGRTMDVMMCFNCKCNGHTARFCPQLPDQRGGQCWIDRQHC